MCFLLWILFPISCSADQGHSEYPQDHWSNYGFCNSFGNPDIALYYYANVWIIIVHDNIIFLIKNNKKTSYNALKTFL
jgi:hypothetical protein